MIDWLASVRCVHKIGKSGFVFVPFQIKDIFLWTVLRGTVVPRHSFESQADRRDEQSLNHSKKNPNVVMWPPTGRLRGCWFQPRLSRLIRCRSFLSMTFAFLNRCHCLTHFIVLTTKVSQTKLFGTNFKFSTISELRKFGRYVERFKVELEKSRSSSQKSLIRVSQVRKYCLIGLLSFFFVFLCEHGTNADAHTYTYTHEWKTLLTGW